jgi:ComF family protein
MTTNGGTRTNSSVWSWLCRRIRFVAKYAEGLVALLYPPECVLCARSLPSLGTLCETCAARLSGPAGPRCAICGVAVEDPMIDLCTTCGTRERGFDRLLALGPYEERWGGLVRALKFERELAVGRWLSARLADVVRRESMAGDFDLITYVPMAGRERRARGFNQARVLARGVARRLGLPMKRTLIKARQTRPQAGLPARERRENLRGAFRAVPSKGARVLLVDDICTTGSTAEECVRALKGAGFSSVSVLVVARA